MIIRQYIPNFVEGIDSVVAEFNTTDELLAIPFVQRWRDGSFYLSKHNSFSVQPFQYLMVEMNDGTLWIVGYIDNINWRGLPEK